MGLHGRDMRRAELVVPYVAPQVDDSAADLGSSLTSTIPMAAMFTRNKTIAWTAVIFNLQQWLGESPEKKNPSAAPGIMSVGMAFLAVIVAYLPLLLPPPARAAAPAPSS